MAKGSGTTRGVNSKEEALRIMSYVEGFTPQSLAIQNYQSYTGIEINEKLRNGDGLTKFESSVVKVMDSDMKPVTYKELYRASSIHRLLEGANVTSVNDLQGKKISEKSFLSTSTDPNFNKIPNIQAYIHFKNTANIKAIDTNTHEGMNPIYANQKEVIVERNASYRIDKIRYDGKYYRIEASFIKKK